MLNIILGLDRSNTPFRYRGRNLSLLVLLALTDAVESYCGVDNASAPFFGLARKMDQCVSDRWGDLLSRHFRGCEGIRNVLNDIMAWTHKVLGPRAAVN